MLTMYLMVDRLLRDARDGDDYKTPPLPEITLKLSRFGSSICWLVDERIGRARFVSGLSSQLSLKVVHMFCQAQHKFVLKSCDVARPYVGLRAAT